MHFCIVRVWFLSGGQKWVRRIFFMFPVER